MIEVGMNAPDFSLSDQNHNLVSLKDFLGKKIVLYFYPKDNTPGCTRQACEFRDSYNEFQSKDIVVIGISKDSVKSHQKFIENYNLPFILLSDEKLEAIMAYGVWRQKNMFGKLSFGVSRSTFIIDEEGKIIKIYPKASPDKNAREILEYFK